MYTSPVSYAHYVYGTIIRAIRVWLYAYTRMVYVLYAYGINMRAVHNIYIS